MSDYLTRERSIGIDGVHVTRVYAGVLAGRLSSQEMLEILLRDLEKRWGKRETEVIPPKLKSGDRLPDYMIALWLSSPTPIVEGDGSELVLVWFSDEPFYESTLDPLKGLEWNSLAKDWWM